MTTGTTEAPMPSPAGVLAHGASLAQLARAAIRDAVGGPRLVRPSGAWTATRVGTFVSLHWHGGALQGCVGSLEPVRGIVDDVVRNADAAAMRDPRGRALVLADVDHLEVELSILSPLERVPGASEAEIVAQLRPGIDGVVLELGAHAGTLLPAVWADVPDVAAFWHGLKRKAGLATSAWSAAAEVWRYTAARFVDPAPGGWA